MTVKYPVGLLLVLLFSSLIALGQNQKQELNDQFWEAVRKGDAASVTALLDKGADVNAKFRYGTTALFKAAERGNLEIVKILLARGADVSVKDTFYGATAITWSLQNDHLDVTKELLEKQPDSVDDVLMSGVSDGKPELVKIALAKGGVKKETLTTALFMAAQNKSSTEIADLLKKAGAVPPPEITAATLQSYVGKYKGDNVEVNVAVSEGTLTASIVGQRGFQLIPTDETTFKPMFADGIVFQFKVADGKVAGLALTRQQNTTQLTRVVENK